MARLRRALVYAATACAFLAASLAPCPSARAVRGTDLALSAPCPCHCGEHAAGSASPLDPVLGSGCEPTPERVRPWPPDAPSFPAASAALSLPDPVPIAS